MLAKKIIFPNGLRVILAPRADALATNLLVLVAAGSKYETKELNGVSHFLEHMCFKGTVRRPRPQDISSELDSLGASYNAFTSHEYTGYWVTVQPKKLKPALDIIADMYLNPVLLVEEIEKEKGVIIEEINMYEDLPPQRVQDLFLELLYGDQPAGRSIAGSHETVRDISRDVLLAYRSKHYLASATLVVVSGGFIESEVLADLQNQFAAISLAEKHDKPPVKEEQLKPAVLIKNRPSDQTHLVVGFRSFGLSHPDYYVFEVLAAVLGGGMSSRLFRRIRDEMGAAYYVRADHDVFTDHGLLQMCAGTSEARAQEVVKVILEECGKLKQEKVLPDELRRVKDSLTGQLYLGLETVSNLGLFYGLQELLKGEMLSPEEKIQKIEAVTAEDLLRAARTLFNNHGLNLAAIGPFPESGHFAQILHLE